MAGKFSTAYLKYVEKLLKEAGDVFIKLISGETGKKMQSKLESLISTSENALKGGVLGIDITPEIMGS